MSVSFKQFSTYLKEIEGIESPERLDEIFGRIFGKPEDKEAKKNQVLTAKDVLARKKEKEEERRKELRKKNDETWLRAKERAEGRSKPGRSDRDEYQLHRTVEEAQSSDLKRSTAEDPEKIAKAKDAVKKAKKALADHQKTYDGGTGARERALQAELDKAVAKLKKLTEDQLTERKQAYSSHGYWVDDAKAAGYKIKKLSGNLMDGDQTWGAFDENDDKVGEFTEKEEGRGGWLLEGKLVEKTESRNKEPGFFTMADTEKILKLDLAAAKQYLSDKVSKTEGASPENERKARKMIAQANNVRKLAIDVSNFILAHETLKNKVIR